MKLATLAIPALLMGSTVLAQDYGPDTCLQGYVWREAFSGDHVCVSPSTRERIARDNALADQRRDPNGGAYGPDTCLPGFVWREAGPDDRVCVTPGMRDRTARDNQLASSRLASATGADAANAQVAAILSEAAANAMRRHETGSRGTAGRAEQAQMTQEPGPLAPAPQSGECSGVRHGIDEEGVPYYETTLSDGSIQRRAGNVITTTRPDGTTQRNVLAFANAPSPTPPGLPSDPSQGRAWVEWLNSALLASIKQLVKGDEASMTKFTAAEARLTGGDIFQQIEFRTNALATLSRP